MLKHTNEKSAALPDQAYAGRAGTSFSYGSGTGSPFHRRFRTTPSDFSTGEELLTHWDCVDGFCGRKIVNGQFHRLSVDRSSDAFANRF